MWAVLDGRERPAGLFFRWGRSVKKGLQVLLGGILARYQDSPQLSTAMQAFHPRRNPGGGRQQG